MKRKIGDIVWIKSIDWFHCMIKNGIGDINFGGSLPFFDKDMSEYCGRQATITSVEEAEN